MGDHVHGELFQAELEIKPGDVVSTPDTSRKAGCSDRDAVNRFRN